MYPASSTLATIASSKMEHGEAGSHVPDTTANPCYSLRCSQAVSVKHNCDTVAALRVGRIRIGAGSYVASQSSITQGVSLPANSRVECDTCDTLPLHALSALFYSFAATCAKPTQDLFLQEPPPSLRTTVGFSRCFKSQAISLTSHESQSLPGHCRVFL